MTGSYKTILSIYYSNFALLSCSQNISKITVPNKLRFNEIYTSQYVNVQSKNYVFGKLVRDTENWGKTNTMHNHS